MTTEVPTSAPEHASSVSAGRKDPGIWPEIWSRAMSCRIGFIPAPVALVLGLTLLALWATGSVPVEITGMIALLGLCGCLLYEIGNRIPLVNQLGGPVILTTFVPAFLVAHQLMPSAMLEGITAFWKNTMFVYLYIAVVIVGSVLSMDRTVLIRGFLKIFAPLALGSLMAMLVGTAVGWALGLGARHTLLFIVIPIMAGGLGEGAIPLTIGYAQILNQDQGTLLAQILPAVMLGNLTAIVLAGGLDMLGRLRPALTGNGSLQVGASDVIATDPDRSSDSRDIAGALMIALMLYLLGLLSHRLFGIPGPVTLLFLAVLLKLVRAVPSRLEAGARSIYKFFAVAVTYPLLFAVGTVLTPWNNLVAALSPASLITIVATVLTLGATGFAVSRMLRLHAIEAALVNVCHSGMGGAGDIAILSAAKRLQLLPFAQISTRIGGAITVAACLLVLTNFYEA